MPTGGAVRGPMTAASKDDVKRKTRGKDSIGLPEAVAIGIGGMVGGGIFSVLGLSVQISGSGAYLSFILGGVISFLTGYSYAKLAVKFPYRGGTVEYLNRAFGINTLTGSLNMLLWIGYIVTLSLYAFSFGSYAASLMPGAFGLWRHIFSSLVIITFTGLNVMGAAIVGRAEDIMVYTKLLILAFFCVVGLFTLNTDSVSLSNLPGFPTIVLAGAVIYVAYEGFELRANAAADLREPKKNLPRAFYICIGLVTVLYIVVALVAVGNLTVSQLTKDAEFALAAAAKPFMGQAGFVLIAIAAVISTASAINATLYGAAKNAYVMAKEKELPKQFEKLIWDRPIEGLLLTGATTLLIVNAVNLENISTMSSSAFLIIFAFVNLSNIKLRKDTDARAWLSFLGFLGCAGSFVTIFIYSLYHNISGVFFLVGMVSASFLMEVTYDIYRKKESSGGP
jgi:amino acid transporter